MRAVLDPNVLISSLLAPTGAPAHVVAAWLDGRFELVVSESLLAGLERAMAYPRLRERIAAADADSFVGLLRRAGILAADPAGPSRRSQDAGDDYLVALAENERALLVSGDRHLVELADRLPVRTPREFLETLD